MSDLPTGSIEHTILRALIDVPPFAAQVMPLLLPDWFKDAGAAVVFTFIAEEFQRHGTVPDVNLLSVLSEHEPLHSDYTIKDVRRLLDVVGKITPIVDSQIPSLLAKTEGWARGRRIDECIHKLIEARDDNTDFAPAAEALKSAREWRLDPSATPAGRFAFQTRDDLLKSSTAAFLVQGLLVQHSLMALVSPPASNKTFLALDLALSIASGQPTWLGRKLRVSGPVVYVLGEGNGMFKLRVQAWDQAHNIVTSYPFLVVNEAVPLTHTADASAFVREVAALKPVLIVFDTLSRCLAGADENNQKDMSAAVRVCDTLRQQLGCAVLLLHHTTKDGSIERGSSVLRGAIDTLLVLKADGSDPHFTMACDKQKDAEQFAPIELKREQVILDERDPETGDPLMSCVIKADAAHASQRVEQELFKAQRFMIANPSANKGQLVQHLGGRKKDVLRKITKWIEGGDLTLRRRAGQASPLDGLRHEAADADDGLGSQIGSREACGNQVGN